jgi:hypothetical protein
MEIVLVTALALSLLANLYFAWRHLLPRSTLTDEGAPGRPRANTKLRSTGISAFGVPPAGPFKEDTFLELGGERYPAMILARNEDFAIHLLYPGSGRAPERLGMLSAAQLKRKPPAEASPEEWAAFNEEVRQVAEALLAELQAKKEG